jgi:cytochrome c biogenesis protein CcdA
MDKLTNKVTSKVTNTYTATRRVIENAEHFVLAVSLVIVAFYNWYDLTIRSVGEVEQYVRLFASVVIALKGAVEIIRFFNKEK